MHVLYAVQGRAYMMLAAIAFIIILLNALYGHHIYGSMHEQALNKYSIYVHLQPGWLSHPANIIYDVTLSWNGTVQEDPAVYNTNRVDTVQGRQVVLLYHGFSDCNSSWSPPLYRYAADLARSAIRNIQGLQLNSDPYMPLLPDTPNEAYPDSRQAALVRSGYPQFIPICTTQGDSSFVYTVSVSDPEVAFDVHFVPSSQESLDYFLDDGSFDEYHHDTCGALNRLSYTGSCAGVGPDSGLLIILPDQLRQSLTRVSVSIHETTSIPDA